MSESHHSHTEHHRMMFRDYRRRFFISTAVTVPILVLSPLVQELFGFSLRVPGQSYIIFALSTFVFFCGGMPFLSGLVSELQSRQPGMITLICLASSWRMSTAPRWSSGWRADSSSGSLPGSCRTRRTG